MEFAAVLKRQRLAAGLSQEELAERARLSTDAVSTLERGVRRAPYRDTIDRLAGALGLSQSEREELAASATRRRGPRAAAPSHAAAAPFPALLTPVVGRDREIATITAMLDADETRLITLLGPGGVGKTTLALAAATAVLDRFAPAVFVPLAALEDAARVPAAIAAALFPAADSPAEPAAAIVTAIGAHEALLVLDNMERLVDAAPFVGELLRACPRLRVLATSREPLRLTGEHELVVPPLPPAPSIALFLDRARRVGLRDTGDAAEQADVAEICRRLDGIPLALELAAARLRVETTRTLLARLAHRLDVLDASRRDAPSRQRTMREAIAWSADRLDDDERRAFARFSAFVDGCDIDAATAVCGDGLADPLGAITALLEKSLLQRDDRGAAPRLRMLETIREYALELLVASGDADATYRLHAQYYAHSYDRKRDGRYGASAFTAASRVGADVENHRAALRWAGEHGHTHLALRLAGALSLCFVRRGAVSEAFATVTSALALPGVDAPDTLCLRAQIRLDLARIAFMRDDRRGSLDAADAALPVLQELGDTRGVGDAHYMRGVAMLGLNDDLDAAQQAIEQSLALRSQPEDEAAIGVAEAVLARIAFRRGDHAGAAERFRRAAELQRESGDRWTAATMFHNLGFVLRRLGRTAEAEGALRESLRVAREIDDRVVVAGSLRELGETLSVSGRTSEAAACLAGSLAGARTIGTPISMLDALVAIARHLERGGDVLTAIRVAAVADGMQRSIGQQVVEDDPELAALLAGLRDQLDPAAFAAAWDEAGRSPQDAIVDEALHALASDRDPLTPRFPSADEPAAAPVR